jgi:hypothetical protein
VDLQDEFWTALLDLRVYLEGLQDAKISELFEQGKMGL